VDHGPGGADDLCNAAAGALVLAISRRQPMRVSDEAVARMLWPTAYGLRRDGVFL
jgi:hypothetical protein